MTNRNKKKKILIVKLIDSLHSEYEKKNKNEVTIRSMTF